ncbi:zinc ribbon domain-containing protein [Lederbergia galactosidilytica]|uniref:zinc ribbon domain-containing protein n=1 Tax=Lederbergia galactosidilytica TaxID=217031 RepID=UPI00103CC253
MNHGQSSERCWIQSKVVWNSRLCSHCGHQHKDVKDLALRDWTCPSCNSHHQFDLNTSINLRNEALRLTAGTVGIASSIRIQWVTVLRNLVISVKRGSRDTNIRRI